MCCGCSRASPGSFVVKKARPFSLSLFPSVWQLVFNPQRRIGVVEALEHPYLADLHAQVR